LFRFSSLIGPVDLGLNILADYTNYSGAAARNYLQVPEGQQNKSLFDIYQVKSINLNIYPMTFSYRALKTRHQRIFITSGLGLQLYNFRYEQPLTYIKNPAGVMLDSVHFTKDKLGLDYLNVPLMVTFKTRFLRTHWLAYGAGITEGYLISSWNKRLSGERGLEKIHGNYGLADFNTCVTAEFGIEDIFRFYASYQLTSMYSSGTGLNQHPFSFGLRFVDL
jgi:hypothetical protein